MWTSTGLKDGNHLPEASVILTFCFGLVNPFLVVLANFEAILSFSSFLPLF